MKRLTAVIFLLALAGCSTPPVYTSLEPLTTYTVSDAETDVFTFTTSNESKFKFLRYLNRGEVSVIQDRNDGFGYRYEFYISEILLKSEDGQLKDSNRILNILKYNRFQAIADKEMAEYNRVLNDPRPEFKRYYSSFPYTTYYQRSVGKFYGLRCMKTAHIKRGVVLNPERPEHQFDLHDYVYWCPVIMFDHTWILSARTTVKIRRDELIAYYGETAIPTDDEILSIVERNLKPLKDSIQLIHQPSQIIPDNMQWELNPEVW